MSEKPRIVSIEFGGRSVNPIVTNILGIIHIPSRVYLAGELSQNEHIASLQAHSFDRKRQDLRDKIDHAAGFVTGSDDKRVQFLEDIADNPKRLALLFRSLVNLNNVSLSTGLVNSNNKGAYLLAIDFADSRTGNSQPPAIKDPLFPFLVENLASINVLCPSGSNLSLMGSRYFPNPTTNLHTNAQTIITHNFPISIGLRGQRLEITQDGVASGSYHIFSMEYSSLRVDIASPDERIENVVRIGPTVNSVIDVARLKGGVLNYSPGSFCNSTITNTNRL